ncbi:hypothetical protein ABZP36_025961 [Zizania latifolia]
MGQEEKCAAPAMVAGAALSSWPAMQQHNAAAYFGLSCALAVLHRSGGRGGCDLGDGRCRWSRRREIALRKRVGELESEVQELRRRRVEDARANEKVAGIFAAHEQRWFAERKGLRRQVHAVVAAARAREVTHEGVVADLRRQLEEQQRAVGLKDEAMEQEVRGREEAEEKLRASEQAEEEVRERARKDAQEHAAELRKHKAAFVELASAQRQLGAELAHAARRGDSAEAELKEALERRDEAAATAAELSSEAALLRRDAEHKDKILSAMLRKSKIDMDDREMLVREVKMCKARRKQAELEADRWRKMWESRHRRGSRSSARCAAADHPGCSDKLTAADPVACAHDTKILFVDHVEESDGKKDRQTTAPAPAPKDPTTVECVDRYPSHVDDKPVVEEYQDLQEWFQMETEKYTSMIRHRHNAEVEAFTEQLRLKDEKLEAFRWRAASMDVEASRLRCRVQELEARLSEQEERSTGLEALLVGRDDENSSLKEQLAASQARSLDGTEICAADGDGGCEHRVPGSREGVAAINLIDMVSPDDAKNEVTTMEATEAVDVVSVQNDAFGASPDELVEHEQPPVAPARVSYTCEIEEEEEEKEVFIDPENARPRDSTDRPEVTSSSSELALVVAAPPEQRTSACKLDIQALAVSYKIKRLKQQLLVLEKLAAAAGGKETATATKSSSNAADAASACGRQQYPRIYQIMVSFLSKHVNRYQSLDDKIDDLCTRMEESKRGGEREQWRRQESEGSREQSAALGHFLEETFQLQRYMVATGQKLLEMQSRIAPSLSRAAAAAAAAGSGDDGVDMGRFMDIVGALLRDVQRGLEVRIARIIGDLEGTLTFHGILHTTF